MSGDERDHSDVSLAGRRLVELLELLGDKGLSQTQIAKRVGTPSQYVSDVKHGRRPLSELFARRLGEEFKVNFLWLLGEEDSRECVNLSAPPSTVESIRVPLFDEAVVGNPREHPRWRGAWYELSGIAASQAAQAVQPFVLNIGHRDHEHRLKKGDLVLVSQATLENPELCIVRCGKNVQLARKKGTKWLRVDTGKPLRGKCEVTGHCLGVIWSALI